ncbi:MAG: sugar phosphate nucleotidyltransferase [Chloroflexota bacterium]
MKITKAVITMAGKNQRHLPMQTLVDRDGTAKSVLQIMLAEAINAGIDDIGLVIQPGDEASFAAIAGEMAGTLTYIPQAEPLGYGHALFCAADFIGSDSFLHLVGDHLFIGRDGESCAIDLIAVAERERCTVSAVKATRESMLPYFGAIGGRRIAGSQDLFQVEKVLEKPTPTVAEQELIVPGLRAGHYLCFFGMHVLTATVIEILDDLLHNDSSPGKPHLSAALSLLAQREQVLALEKADSRYDLGGKYGLFMAQLALGLNGQDRDEMLSSLVEMLASR